MTLDPKFGCTNPQISWLVNDLREKVKDVIPASYDTDFNLARWLIGWNYDLEETARKLRKHLELRELFDFNRPTEELEVHPILLQHYPNCYLETQAHDGSLIYIMMFSLADTHGLVRSVSSLQFYESRLAVVEKQLRRMMKVEEKTGTRCSITYIIDLEGLKMDGNLMAVTRGQFAYLTHLMQDNYVELINRILIVNEGSIINTLYNMISPMVPARTREKVKMLGADWRTEILNYIPAESLPIRWGGTIEDEKQVMIPTKVPKNLYWSARNTGSGPDLTVTSVGRSSAETLQFDFLSKQGKLNWSFFSDGEISFGIYRVVSTEGDKELEEQGKEEESFELVYPDFMVVADYVPIEDELKCNDGVYIVKFTNNSWIFSKTIRHNFSVSFE